MNAFLLPDKDDYPIYKSLFGLKILKKQIKFSPIKSKIIKNYLDQYNKAIKEAKDYKSKSPSTSSNKDLFKAGATAYLAGAGYASPKQYTNKNEWETVIRELTACKKYLEDELKHLESAVYESTTNYNSLFNFEFE